MSQEQRQFNKPLFERTQLDFPPQKICSLSLNHVRLSSPRFIPDYLWFLRDSTESLKIHHSNLSASRRKCLARLIVGNYFLSNGASPGLCEPPLRGEDKEEVGEEEEYEEEEAVEDRALQGTVNSGSTVLSCSFSLAQGCPGNDTGRESASIAFNSHLFYFGQPPHPHVVHLFHRLAHSHRSWSWFWPAHPPCPNPN